MATRPFDEEFLDPNRVAVFTRDGRFGFVDQADLRAHVERGGRMASPEELDEVRTKKEYGGNVFDETIAGALGTARGLSLGLSDQLLTYYGAEGETLRKYEEANPKASFAGEVVGNIAPLVLSGGTSAGATGAKAGLGAAAEGVRAAGAIPRAVMGASQAVEKSIARRLVTEGMEAGLKKTALTYAPKIAGSAIEGAFYGAGQVLTEDAFERKDLTAETLLAGMGTGALFGAAVPTVIGGGGYILSKPARRAANSLKKASDFMRDFLQDVIVDKSAGMVGDLAGSALGYSLGGLFGGAAGGIAGAVGAQGQSLAIQQAVSRAGSAIGETAGKVAGVGIGIKAAKGIEEAVPGAMGAHVGKKVGQVVAGPAGVGVGAAAGAALEGAARAGGLEGVAAAGAKAAGAAAIGAGMINKTVRGAASWGLPKLSETLSGMPAADVRRSLSGIGTAAGATRRRIQNMAEEELDDYVSAFTRTMQGTKDDIGAARSFIDKIDRRFADVSAFDGVAMDAMGDLNTKLASARNSAMLMRQGGSPVLPVIDGMRTELGKLTNDMLDEIGRAIKGSDEELLDNVLGQKATTAAGPVREAIGTAGKRAIEGVNWLGDKFIETAALAVKTKDWGALDSLGLTSWATKRLRALLEKAGDGAEAKLAAWVKNNPEIGKVYLQKLNRIVAGADEALEKLDNFTPAKDVAGRAEQTSFGFPTVGTNTEARKLVALLRSDLQKHMANPNFYGEAAEKAQALYGSIYPYERLMKRMEGTLVTEGKFDHAKVKALMQQVGASDPAAAKIVTLLTEYLDRSKALIDEINKQDVIQKLIKEGGVDSSAGIKFLEEALDSIEDVRIRGQLKTFRAKNPFLKEALFLSIPYLLGGGPVGVGLTLGVRMLNNPALAVRMLGAIEGFSARVAADINKSIGQFMAESRAERSLGTKGKRLAKKAGRAGAVPIPISGSSFANIYLGDDDEKPADTAVANQRDAFQRMSKQLTSLMANPEKVLSRVTGATQGLSVFAPQLTQALAMKGMGALTFLWDKMPKDPHPENPFSKKRWTPTDAEINRFARFVRAVEKPQSVIEDLSHGRVTREGVEALRTVYPELFGEISSQLFSRVTELKASVPYQQRVQLSLFFGIPVDDLMKPGTIQKLQSLNAPKEQQKQPATKKFDVAEDRTTEVQAVANR